MSGVITEGDGIEVNLPVGLAAERDPGHFPGIVALVNATEGSHGIIALLVGITQIEGEDRLIQQALVKHVVEGRDDFVDGDGVIAQSQNTVKATKGESKARFARCLSKVLILDLQVANLHDILRDKTAEAARAISDGELGSVLFVRG